MARTAPPPRMLLRFPGPLALQRVLAGERPTLHHADAPRVFLGDDRLWDWPGVREFGALAILDADRFAPVPHGIDGWFTCAVRPLGPDDALYVPDPECARAVSGARTARTARRRLPDEYGTRVERARAAMADYDALAARIEAARPASGARPDSPAPADLDRLLDRPLHMLRPDERARLAAALRA